MPLHMVFVPCHHYRYVGMMGNVVCDTSGDRPPQLTFAAAADDDVAGVPLICQTHQRVTGVTVRP